MEFQKRFRYLFFKSLIYVVKAQLIKSNEIISELQKELDAMNRIRGENSSLKEF